MGKIQQRVSDLKMRHVAYALGALLTVLFLINFSSASLLGMGKPDVIDQDLADKIYYHIQEIRPAIAAGLTEEERSEFTENIIDQLAKVENGGEVNVAGKWEEIEPATGEKLEQVQEVFKALRSYEAKFGEDPDIGRSYYTDLNRVAKQFTDSTKEAAIAKETSFNRVLMLSLSLTLFIYTLIYLLFRNHLLGPIYLISRVSRRLVVGNLEETIRINAKSEIGHIARNINDLANLLNDATEFTKEVGEGNLDVKYKDEDESEIDPDSIAGALITMREKMKAIATQDYNRNWSTQGLAHFGNILRLSDQNSDQLANHIISELVQYLKASQGCIYFLADDGDSQVLELKGSYAFGRKKFNEEQIDIGEGLIGQGFLERKTVYLTNIPDDFVSIRSGLGDAAPNSILIAPLLLNDDVLGMIEIASFEGLATHEIEFVEKLGESIASTISNAMINNKTSVLLEETQLKTQEIMVREEEMRQNMEELMATQEEMGRQEREYIDIIEGLRAQVSEANPTTK
jgi:HAMP domain-containing protein